MSEAMYEVTGSIWGKRYSERFQTLEEARAMVWKLSVGTIWFLGVHGRVRKETRDQAIRNSAKGGVR